MLYANNVTLRKRAFPSSIPLRGKKVVSYPSDPSIEVDYSTVVNPIQVTWSEGHPISAISQMVDGSLLDIGGPFLTGRLVLDRPGRLTRQHYAFGNGPGFRKEYRGPVTGATIAELWHYDQPLPPDKGFETTKALKVFEDLSSTTLLNTRGTAAIARCNPTSQQAGLFVALKETYSDGLPKVPGVSRDRVRRALRDYREKKAAGVIKGPAEEYLNFVFGVLPLLADAKSLQNSIQNFEKNYQQFVRNANKIVHRTYHFPMEESKVIISDGNITSGWPSDVSYDTFLFSGVLKRPHYHYKVVKRYQKFSGSFTYFLGDDLPYQKLAKLNAEADYLFGAGLTLENLWNASPWTWLVDWFFNAGDVISNLSDVLANNLVMHYGYMMEKTIANHSCDCSPAIAGGTDSVVLRDLNYSVVAKQRIRASPFGFGLTESGLSAKQKLILAALGITRV